VLLSEREIRLVQSKRVDAMIDALSKVPDLGDANSVKLKPNGAWEGRTFSDKQLAAFDALPDDVLSPAMKSKLRQLNELARQDGQQIILDYNAALKGGKYSSGIAPSTRAAVPLTFNISKAGNFYMATLDTTHFFRKLGQWRKSKPKAFDAWNGDVDAFLRDAFTYLDNHVNGRSGAVNLDSDAAAAVHKKNVINDFFNVPKGAGNEDANPVQLSQRGDKDNLIRSRRFDRINRITPGAGDKFPVRYELQKANYLPAGRRVKRDWRKNPVNPNFLPANPQTTTPQFKQWFGDSKVVDADGKPLVVYHGTAANVHKFKQGNGELGQAIYFSTSETIGNLYGRRGNRIDAYLKANPYELSQFRADPEGQSAVLAQAIIQRGTLPTLLKDMKSPELAARIRQTWNGENSPRRWVEMAGFDALTDKQSQIPSQIAVFNQNQIKSATSNRGTFDLSNPDIRFLPAGVSPVAIHKQLRAQAEFDLAQKAPGPTNLNQWLASTYLDVLDKKLNKGSAITRTAQLQRIKTIADATTAPEMSTAFAALLTGGQNGAKAHLERLAAMKALTQ